jgi:hypothetical protein
VARRFRPSFLIRVLADLSTPRRVFAEINNEQRVPLDEQRLRISQTRGALA